MKHTKEIQRIVALETLVFTILIKINEVPICQTCSELANNFNEMNLIEDTGVCKECYEEEYGIGGLK